MEVSRPSPITYFWEITLIEEDKEFKPSAFFMRTKLSTPKKYTFWEETTSQPPSPESMDFMRNVKSILFR